MCIRDSHFIWLIQYSLEYSLLSKSWASINATNQGPGFDAGPFLVRFAPRSQFPHHQIVDDGADPHHDQTPCRPNCSSCLDHSSLKSLIECLKVKSKRPAIMLALCAFQKCKIFHEKRNILSEKHPINVRIRTPFWIGLALACCGLGKSCCPYKDSAIWG